MGKSAPKRNILTRRWVWMSIAALVIFIAGVAVGATGHGGSTHTPCPAISSATHREHVDG